MSIHRTLAGLQDWVLGQGSPLAPASLQRIAAVAASSEPATYAEAAQAILAAGRKRRAEVP
jgi:hypothetical protein